ncbi:MAG: zf-HC2 domain-containing protein [Acidobacteriota bacterium]
MTRNDTIDCGDARERLEDLVAGDLADIETARLLAHLRHCEACSELFDLHARLTEWESPESAPESDDFSAMRRRVQTELALEGRTRTASPRFGRWSITAWRPALAAGLATALLSLGWWAGRAGRADGTAAAPLSLAALAAHGDFSPYDFENVRVREIDASTVALSFDLATHLELVRPTSDPLVTEALVQSILGGSDLGGRLHAISQTGFVSPTGETLAPRIRQALIQAMLEDPSVAVRMQAQERLARAAPDPTIEEACLRVLEEEDSVQMRLVAIDILTAGGISSERLLEAVEAGRPESGNALRVRAASHLNSL